MHFILKKNRIQYNTQSGILGGDMQLTLFTEEEITSLNNDTIETFEINNRKYLGSKTRLLFFGTYHYANIFSEIHQKNRISGLNDDFYIKFNGFT